MSRNWLEISYPVTENYDFAICVQYKSETAQEIFGKEFNIVYALKEGDTVLYGLFIDPYRLERIERARQQVLDLILIHKCNREDWKETLR